MIRVDFHTHTADDPVDLIPYTTTEMIDRAAELGFGALALTLHNRQRITSSIEPYARERGIVLIPGVECTIEGRHVLLLNFPSVAESIETFEALAQLRKRHPDGMVIAPHPFFPHLTCLRGRLDRHAELFDAVELNAFYTRWVDFNRQAIRWAHAHGKPIVANSDSHRLTMLGSSSTLVDADATVGSICAAVKAGRVQCHTRPLSVAEAAAYISSLALCGRRAVPAERLGAAGSACPLDTLAV